MSRVVTTGAGVFEDEGKRRITLLGDVERVTRPRSPLCRFSDTYGTDSSGWNSTYSIIWRVRGLALYNFANKFTMNLKINAGGTFVWTGFVARRTLAGSTTFIDSVVVKFGGSSAPSMAASAVYESDPIALPLSGNYDYYVIGCVNASTASAAAFARGNETNAEVIAGWQTGDQRAATTVTGYALSILNVYGAPQLFTVEGE